MSERDQPAWAPTFDRMYATDDDPWQFRSRWYEARKRALTLASLAREHYRQGFEIGCSNGELTALLATRCDRLWACDTAARAVELAAWRVAEHGNVVVERRSIPREWPAYSFDLIVFSEVGYFMDRAALTDTIERFRVAHHAGATVLACHWRRPIEHGWIDGDGVHALITQTLGESLGGWRDDDFRVDQWTMERRSVAQLDGLVEAG